MKSARKFPTFFSILLSVAVLLGVAPIAFRRGPFPMVSYVLGEDDEDEDEHEHEDDEDDDKDDDSPGTVTVWETRYETRQIEKTFVVTPEEYRTDSDGDGLVDAVDPDPTVRQQDYFTDSDDDAVPDAMDRHPGEDDFAFLESGTDDDGDGIVDAYGTLPVR